MKVTHGKCYAQADCETHTENLPYTSTVPLQIKVCLNVSLCPSLALLIEITVAWSRPRSTRNGTQTVFAHHSLGRHSMFLCFGAPNDLCTTLCAQVRVCILVMVFAWVLCLCSCVSWFVSVCRLRLSCLSCVSVCLPLSKHSR